MSIPPRVHRIWLDDPMPDQFAEYGRIWDDLHPEWDRTDWTDSGKLPELHNQDLFDRAKEHYPDDWKRLQADLLRLEVLWLFGGVYSDTDARPLRPLRELLDGQSCVLARSPQHIDGVHPITNCFMAATPGHPYLLDLINGCAQALADYGDRNLAQSVGPWHLTRVYEAEDRPDVTVADFDFFGHWIGHDWNNAARKRGEGVWPEGAPSFS